MRILVSLCLLGAPVRYDGQGKPCAEVLALEKRHQLIPICPEQLGGLTTPRPPAEIQPNGQVVNREGQDVTDRFEKGADIALRLAQTLRADIAILKSKSPSCGKGLLYDGAFSKTLVEGDGVTARKLQAHGVKVYTENDLRQDSIPELK